MKNLPEELVSNSASNSAKIITAAQFDKIPIEMRDAKRWLMYKLEPNEELDKKPRKVPYYANGRRRSGKLDTPADQGNLVNFDVALSLLLKGIYIGLGFALGPDVNDKYWQGIDLDDLANHPELNNINLQGYVEVSPSGNGLHAIGYGQFFPTLGSNSTGIEAYAKGRYFTVTGNAKDSYGLTCIADLVQKVLKPMHSKALPPLLPTENTVPEVVGVQDQTIRDLRSALLFMHADDRDLWIRMGLALKTLGDIGRGLWLEWSSVSLEKFDVQGAISAWESFNPEHISYQAVFAAAQQMGWLNPSSKGSLKTPLPTGFEFIPVHHLLKKPEPIVWLIEDMIEIDTLVTIFGASGAGKSFLALDWACSVATGEKWNERPTNCGAVFYIAGEGHAGIRRRLKAWEINRKVPLQNAPLYVSNCPAALMDISSASSVANAVELLAKLHGKPSLIVIDTLARNFGAGEENNNSDIGVFINNIDTQLRDRFKATVLIVHHSGHNEKERGIYYRWCE